MSCEELAGILADAVAEWLADQELLDTERPGVDWGIWREDLAKVIRRGLAPPPKTDAKTRA